MNNFEILDNPVEEILENVPRRNSRRYNTEQRSADDRPGMTKYRLMQNLRRQISNLQNYVVPDRIPGIVHPTMEANLESEVLVFDKNSWESENETEEGSSSKKSNLTKRILKKYNVIQTSTNDNPFIIKKYRPNLKNAAVKVPHMVPDIDHQSMETDSEPMISENNFLEPGEADMQNNS